MTEKRLSEIRTEIASCLGLHTDTGMKFHSRNELKFKLAWQMEI